LHSELSGQCLRLRQVLNLKPELLDLKALQKALTVLSDQSKSVSQKAEGGWTEREQEIEVLLEDLRRTRAEFSQDLRDTYRSLRQCAGMPSPAIYRPGLNRKADAGEPTSDSPKRARKQHDEPLDSESDLSGSDSEDPSLVRTALSQKLGTTGAATGCAVSDDTEPASDDGRLPPVGGVPPTNVLLTLPAMLNVEEERFPTVSGSVVENLENNLEEELRRAEQEVMSEQKRKDEELLARKQEILAMQARYRPSSDLTNSGTNQSTGGEHLQAL
jgi:hypothetical protein